MARKKSEKIEHTLIDDEKLYATPQVLKLFGLTPGLFRPLIKDGYIKADREASGSGFINYFSKKTLYVIRVFMHFRTMGFNRYISSDLAYRVLEFIETFYDGKNPLFIVLEWTAKPKKDKHWSKYIWLYGIDDPLVDLKAMGVESAFILDIQTIVEEIDKKLM